MPSRAGLLYLGLAMAVTGSATGGDPGEVPTCHESAPEVPSSWQAPNSTGSQPIALPADCQVDPKQPGYFHGGTRWLCGAASVEVVWGYWGKGSFGEIDRSTRCQAHVGEYPALVVRHQPDGGAPGFRLSVWYLTSRHRTDPTADLRSYEPVVAVSAPSIEELEALAPAAFSWRPTTKEK